MQCINFPANAVGNKQITTQNSRRLGKKTRKGPISLASGVRTWAILRKCMLDVCWLAIAVRSGTAWKRSSDILPCYLTCSGVTKRRGAKLAYSCPRTQHSKGRNKPHQKYVMTENHKSGFDKFGESASSLLQLTFVILPYNK